MNLDYFPMGQEEMETHISSSTTFPNKNLEDNGLGDSSWEKLLADMDNSNNYAGAYANHTMIYNCTPPEGLHQATSSMSESQDWTTPGTDDTWPNISAIDLPKGPVPQSVFSFSEESMASQDDLVFSVAGSHSGSSATNDSLDAGDNGLSGFNGIAMPTVDDGFDFHELDDRF